MEAYPRSLDSMEETAGHGLVGAEEAQAALHEAETYLGQFGESQALGIRSLQRSGEQVDVDIAAHTSAGDALGEAYATHTAAGFGEGNAAATKAEQHLGNSVVAVNDELSALVSLQHFLTLGSAVGFADRRKQLPTAEIKLAVAACRQLLEEQLQAIEGIKKYREARIAEYAACQAAKHQLAQARQLGNQAIAKCDETPDQTPAKVAAELNGILELLSDVPQLLQTAAGQAEKIASLIEEADAIISQWQGQAPIPNDVVTAHRGILENKAELQSPRPGLPQKIENDAEHLGLTKRALELAGNKLTDAKDNIGNAAHFVNRTDTSIDDYITSRGG